MAEDQNLRGIRDAVPSAGSPGTSVQVLESHNSRSSSLSTFLVIPFSSSNKRTSPHAEERRCRGTNLLPFPPLRPRELSEADKSLHDCYIARADGSEGAEILERRSRELVRSRGGRLVDVTLSRARVPGSVVQVNDSFSPQLDLFVPRLFDLEPVGSKAPAFQSDAKSVTYVRAAKSSLAITCAAQASPPPTHR